MVVLAAKGKKDVGSFGRGSYSNGRAVKILSGRSSGLKLYACKFSDLYSW